MKITCCVALTQSQLAKVDLEDFVYLKQVKWRALWYPESKTFYAVRNVGRKTYLMHRQITKPSSRFTVVDHKNHDGLDNRKSNLRKCSQTQNLANSRKRLGCSSKYKGVNRRKNSSRWHAYIQVNLVRKHLGYFDTAELAAAAYDKAAVKHFGEFALTNF